MIRKFKLNSVIKAVSDEGDELRITGYASTSDTDRVGDVIIPDAWTKGGLENYLTNPIVLFNHNYQQAIGRAENITVDSKGLKIECLISKSAGNIYGLIKDGVLSTFSVGFMIKDADYNEVSDGYIIREAELLEVSVVSVPCNQAASFSVSKSLDNAEEKTKFHKEVNALKGQKDNSAEVKASNIDSSPKSGNKFASEIKTMTPEEIAALVAEQTAKALAAHKEAEEKIAKEKANEKAAEEAATTRATKAAEAATASVEEKLLASFATQMKANEDNWTKTFEEMKGDLEAKSAELKAMGDSKRFFADNKSNADPLKQFAQEAEDAFILAKALRKPVDRTKFYTGLAEKFNLHSTVNVGTDRLETEVSTNIERDIWNELILAPMFREINMNSAQMSFPIMPDAGYAEITTATIGAGTQPNGNVDQRGAAFGAPYAGVTLTEKLLSTVKLISKSYLGNETEEDAILPILPLIKEAMIRSHARGIENMLLLGNSSQGVYTSGAANGLLKFASTANRTVTTVATNTPLTSASLLGLRKLMGKYGMDPRNVVYIVSQDCYFQLISDPEFADADLVGSQANKLTGTVGRLYGSEVVVCDEFAPAATGMYHALAVNRRNFVIPRLRGIRVESEYQVEEQRTTIVASQRLGFDEIIPNAPAVIGLKYL